MLFWLAGCCLLGPAVPECPLPDEVVRMDHPGRSPGGAEARVELSAVEGGRELRLTVTDSSGRVVRDQHDFLYPRFRNLVIWEGERLWIYNGDVGTHFLQADAEGCEEQRPWERDPDGGWRLCLAREGVPQPERVRSYRHDRTCQEWGPYRP